MKEREKSGSQQLGGEEPTPPAEGAPEGSHRGPLEALIQEAIRRALSLSLGGFFMTEEAVRKALSESVPREWIDYISRQSEGVRSDLTERLVHEFAIWLRSVDLDELLARLLKEYEFTARIEISARDGAQDPAASLKVVRRSK